MVTSIPSQPRTLTLMESGQSAILDPATELVSVGQLQLAQYSGGVCLHGAWGDGEPSADLLKNQPVSKPFRHVADSQDRRATQPTAAPGSPVGPAHTRRAG
jgi:hypothetical protein